MPDSITSLPTKHVQTVVDFDTHKRLHNIALNRGVSLMDLLREVLTEWSNNQEKGGTTDGPEKTG
jgi:hypothetical protein